MPSLESTNGQCNRTIIHIKRGNGTKQHILNKIVTHVNHELEEFLLLRDFRTYLFNEKISITKNS
jgi:hypothetical protein